MTADWRDYQPAADFCVLPDVIDLPTASDATATGVEPGVPRSGSPRDTTGLVEVKIDTPPLCADCRR